MNAWQLSNQGSEKKNDVGLVQILLKNDNTLSLEDYWELQAIGKLHKFDNSLI